MTVNCRWRWLHALAQDTRLSWLDEPTAHLDLNNRVEIMNLLRRLARSSNKAILVATQYEAWPGTSDSRFNLAGGRRQRNLSLEYRKIWYSMVHSMVFQFKGFDLKTGKVFHEAWRNHTVNLIGWWLWVFVDERTRWKRNGFIVDKESPDNHFNSIPGKPDWMDHW